MRTIFQDDHRFWFGQDYRIKCPDDTARTQITCYNPLSNNTDSLNTRLFEPGKFNSTQLNGYIRVQYYSPPGSYEACGDFVQVEDNVSFTLDPTTDNILTPWQTRKRPLINWVLPDKLSQTSYTLMFVDAGLGKVLALFTNIQRSELGNMTEVIPYQSPVNFRSIPNPYVFMLFEQTELDIKISRRWQETFKWPLYRFVQDFTSDHNLKGPVAVTWVLVSSDLYATEKNRISGWFDNCPHYIANAIQQHRRPFVPPNLSLTIGVYISFSSNSLVYHSCCRKHKAKATTIKLNPLGDGTVKAVETRTDSTPHVTLTFSAFYKDQKKQSSRNLYTLLMVDPDIPVIFSNLGNSNQPLVHWMVVNILDGNVSLGEELHSYMGPLPPDDNPHYYYYFLFLQPWKLSLSNTEGFYSDCGEALKGRCLFRLKAFVQKYHLVFAGATWMVSNNDEYVQGVYLRQGSSPDEVCANSRSYHPGCLQNNIATTIDHPTIVVILSFPTILFIMNTNLLINLP